MLVCFALPAAVCADIIYLHDGRVFSGKILLENKTFVRIDTLSNDDGQIKEFLLPEIKSIDYSVMEILEVIKQEALPPLEEIKEEPAAVISSSQEDTLPERPSEQRPELNSGPSLTSEIVPVPPEIPAITDTLNQPTDNQHDGIVREIDDRQSAQVEPKSEESMKSKSTAQIGFKAAGLLWAVTIVLLLICGALGLLLAKKLDGEEEVEEEVVETIVQRTPYDSPYPIQEVPHMAKKKKKLEKRGGLIRRLIARSIDLYLGVGILLIFYSLLGLLIPLDRYGVLLFLVIMLPFMLVFSRYSLVGFSKLNNTYGRYLVGIRVVDAQTGEKPSLRQAFKRDVLLFFWPVDFFILMFSKSKRRIGDSWACTKVIVVPSPPLWIRRMVPGLILGIFIYMFFPVVSPFINDRMMVAQVAKDYLAREYGAGNLTRPERVEIYNNAAKVNLKLKNGESYSVHLLHDNNGWAVQQVQKIPESFLGKGYSIHYRRS
jgi:uncharacterized RDD family membrane protein YckC